jgi:hypothetical protein
MPTMNAYLIRASTTRSSARSLAERDGRPRVAGRGVEVLLIQGRDAERAFRDRHRSEISRGVGFLECVAGKGSRAPRFRLSQLQNGFRLVRTRETHPPPRQRHAYDDGSNLGGPRPSPCP